MPDPKPIQLQLNAAAVADEKIAGWTAKKYILSGAARGDANAAPIVQPGPEAVLELELADGTRLLVAAEDAERYLGPAQQARGEGAQPVIQVGPMLRLSGSHLPGGPSRDGFGAWALKSLRVFDSGPAGMTALAAAGSFQDKQLENRVGLFHCATDRWNLSQVSAMPAQAEPVLLFLHGTASSTEGSFSALWESKYRQRLVDAYGERIYALEHRSLTESPISNALDLVKCLPKGARLHLVSHSRGGMIGELLARANRLGQQPFSAADIERFLACANGTGRDGFEADAARLAELNTELLARQIRVERFVRVACPARGTTLASGRLDRWASVMLNLIGAGVKAAAGALPVLTLAADAYDLLQNFLLAVVKERTDAHVLPGLEAMMPDSPLVALLNAPDVEIEHPLHVLAGDYAGDGLLSWLGDCLSEAFYGGQTDIVVNTPSMSGGAARRKGIWQKAMTGPDVYHFSYFRRDESALPLLEALRGDDHSFQALDGPSREFISRGGKNVKPNPTGPIAFLLPGIMGSHIQLDGERIWFNPARMMAGEIERLGVGVGGVTPDGWLDLNYERLAQHLAVTHEVWPFAYDWRLSIADAADAFGDQLDKAMKEAAKRGKPVRIVAHSMGGLVARLALESRWQQFKAIPGSRLLQLGTPNRGSHSIAAVLLGRDDFVQMIERWFDWKHNMREFLDIVRGFPGVLELLPWPGDDGNAPDGVDYYNPALWQDWATKDSAANTGKGWEPPSAKRLAAAKAVITRITAARLDQDCTLYVAGCGDTPVGVRIVDGQVEIASTREGDGRVPWKTGIPGGVRVWYADAAHGDLANLDSAFPAYVELLETGRTGLLPQTPPSVRGAATPIYRPRAFGATTLYPSADEVLAAATGGARPRRGVAPSGAPAAIEVIHGSLSCAESPVLIGAYANDSLRGSARFLDHHLGGRLQHAVALGRYPSRLADCSVFWHPKPDGKPGGAVVVGLGPVGQLMPGNLRAALTNGLLEYARVLDQQTSGAAAAAPIALSALVVGAGFGGLSVALSVRCLIEAVVQANRTLDKARMPRRIGRISLFEEVEDRAVAAVESLRELVRVARFGGAISFDGVLREGEGGYRGGCAASGGANGWSRVHIIADADHALRFTLISDRARAEVDEEPNQRQAVDGLIHAATETTIDQPGLSRALFELMVPNGMKEAVADMSGLILAVDGEAAIFPWELMRGRGAPDEPPLAARVGVIRQLASPYGRGRVPIVSELSAFVVGDTRSKLPELLGAQQEGLAVAGLLRGAGYNVLDLYRTDPMDVFENLFDGQFRIMHFAGHGAVDAGKDKMTGMVLGDGVYLTTAQISKLSRVPEFVFINCCHLGSMEADAHPRWGKLAAGLATEFIEMGCKAVIAAGWAVDDDAAGTFARRFYQAMLGGACFGDAVLEARAMTWDRHRATNTWGAFQAYGDERYRFAESETKSDEAPNYVNAGQLTADLDQLIARIKGATHEERQGYANRLHAIEDAAAARFYDNAAVRERFGTAWAELDEKEKAIDHYRAALALEDAGLSLHALEQLANLEIRLGAKLAESAKTEQRQAGEALMQAGLTRLETLIGLGATVERLSLLGSYWKRRAQIVCSGSKRKGRAEELRAALASMQESYWKAAKESVRRTGVFDYYPLLNALDGAFLEAAWGERAPLDQRDGDLASLLEAAAADGRRRYAAKREFFHAQAEIEALRVDALWACFDQRPSHAITDPAVRDAVLAHYCDLLRRLGSARERDSTVNQFRFLASMLPEKPACAAIREALLKIAAEIGKCDVGGA